ncbi:aspartic-type endopeptidase [Paramyrothecium foliicola]|nr:aspartic-type endopeptidase [Paramyrothecium foliicola]
MGELKAWSSGRSQQASKSGMTQSHVPTAIVATRDKFDDDVLDFVQQMDKLSNALAIHSAMDSHNGMMATPRRQWIFSDGHDLHDWDFMQPMNGIVFERVKAHTQPSIDRPTRRFSRLRSIHSGPSSHAALSVVGRAARSASGALDSVKYQNISAIGDFSTQYAIQCAWDGVPLWLLFDTGSSDTWASAAGFECQESPGNAGDQSACGFGRPQVFGFGHGEIDDLHFYLRYGSGEEVSGPMGYSDISCGGLSVAEQQVGLANATYWHGNNVTVGILGLAYPSLTSAYFGDIGDEAEWNAVTYTPFFTSAIIQGAIDPVFSVAIMKNSTDGVLAWGGLPPFDLHRGKPAATDLIIAKLVNQSETAWKYSFYTIIPDGFKWDETIVTSRYPCIVDTGTTMMHLPPPMAESIAKAFQPRAVYMYQWGAYFVKCNAIPPRLAVTISGKDFWINSAYMIYKNLIDPLTGYCAIAITSGGSGPYILGDVFLQNVVAVFDVGGAEMRFYAR